MASGENVEKRVSGVSTDILDLIIDLRGDIGNSPNRSVSELEIDLLCLEQCDLLLYQVRLWLSLTKEKQLEDAKIETKYDQ